MKLCGLLVLFLFTLGNCKRCENENWINRCKNSDGPMAMMKTGDCDFCNNTQRFCEGECLGIDFFTCWDRHVFEKPEPCNETSCEVVDGKRTGICTMGDIVPKLEDVKPEENEKNGKGPGEEETSDDGKEKIPDNNKEKPKENDETKSLENDDKSVPTNNPNKEVVKEDQQDGSKDISNVKTPNDGSNNKEKPKKAPDTAIPTNNQSKVGNFTEPADNFKEPADDKEKNKCNDEGGTCDGKDDKDSDSTTTYVLIALTAVGLPALIFFLGRKALAKYQVIQEDGGDGDGQDGRSGSGQDGNTNVQEEETTRGQLESQSLIRRNVVQKQ
ncbi:uncharacterized protein LOC100179849 [Ciona intestinalis]